MKKYVVAVAVVLAVVACTKSDSVLGPSTPNTTVSQQEGQAGASDAVPNPGTVVPTTGTTGAKVWAHGVVDVYGPWEGFVCYFWKGPHEQDKAAPDVPVSVEAGETVTIPWPNIKPDGNDDHCEVQIDVGTSCARSSIIPGMLAAGYKKVAECKTECAEAPVETITCTECPTGNVKPEDCYRTCTKTTDYQCKDDVVTTYTENCACTTSCVPGEWEITNTEQTGEEWGECQRQAVNASTVRPPGCLKQGTATFLITEFNGCDTRTRTETRSIREGCECPDPGECYYTPDCRLDARAFHTATAACPEEAKQRLCEAEGGIWGNWNSQHNQCKTDLPGLYLENFRLVPGQSHPDCLKFTGN